MTDRPRLVRDHYLDALALSRASLAGDDAAALAVVSNCDIGLTIQAVIHLYLSTIYSIVGTTAEVDEVLVRALRDLPDPFPVPADKQQR